MALNSWEFAAVALLAIVILPSVRGWLKTGAFLALNGVFIWSYWGAAGLPIGLAFCLAGYVAARVVSGRSGAVLAASLVILTAAFLYLRGYSWGV